jgi:hypothetical protein
MSVVVHLHVEYDGWTGSTLGGWLCRDCGKWSMNIDDLPGTMTVGGQPRKGYVPCTSISPRSAEAQRKEE